MVQAGMNELWLLVFLLASGANATPERVADENTYESLDACLLAAHAKRKTDKQIRGAWCVDEIRIHTKSYEQMSR